MKAAGITITVLAENSARRPDLLGEHGLAFWIETPDSCVLFDTGQGLVLAHNADALRVPLDCADAIVLSHGHYDHTGGLPYALGQSPEARLFLHPAALQNRFSLREGQARAIGMAALVCESLKRCPPIWVWTSEPTEIMPGLYVTGPIPRLNDFEDTGGPFFLDKEGQHPDPIIDDQALWMETSRGVVVLLGCAHSGVVNTLNFIRRQVGERPLIALIGGMHLGAASADRIQKTVAVLEQMNVTDLWPCHCTGADATARLKMGWDDRCHACGVGTKIKF